MSDRPQPEDRLIREIRKIERILIIWSCAMILLAGVLGFIAGRLARG
jgi:hypothetical protein